MSPTVSFPDFSSNREHGVAQALTCAVHAGDVGPVWVHLAGDLDISGALRLEQALHHAGTSGREIVLDLRQLTSVDFAGVDVIVNASARARQARRRLMLLRGPPHVDRALALAATSDVLDIVDLDPPEAPAQALPQRVWSDDVA
jgi:anti-anti-sigma factor